MLIRSCIFALIFSCALVHAEEPKKIENITRFFPGNGVLDISLKWCYLTNTEGQVEAVDFATGKVLWRSMRNGWPILAAEGNLYILACSNSKDKKHPAFFVQTLSIKGEGKCIAESEPINAPEAAVAGAGQREVQVAGRLENQSLSISCVARTENETYTRYFAINLKDQTLKLIDNPKLGGFSVGGVIIGERRYDKKEDLRAGKISVVCTEQSSKKLLWTYDVDPGMLKPRNDDE